MGARCRAGAELSSDRRVFDGWIAGLGTSEGTRVVIGRWTSSPWGPFVDAMVERSDGHRVLLAPTVQVADFVATTYRFDEVQVVPVRLSVRPRTWDLIAGPLTVGLEVGGPTIEGRALGILPRALVRSRAFAVAADPVVRLVMPGVRTRGAADGGRSETYAASARYSIVAARVRWAGVDLGVLADVEPAVRFGFSSTPRRPGVTRVRTVVRG